MIKEVEFGGRFNPEVGLQFFGIEEVNALLYEGYQLTQLRPKGAITSKHPRDKNGEVLWALSGFVIIAVLEKSGNSGA
ncbi:MAG: hypothetical protein JXB10_01650 [Pirellulales bacterium]|nr:hypothetical protein [Pirellulales bacterium]